MRHTKTHRETHTSTNALHTHTHTFETTQTDAQSHAHVPVFLGGRKEGSGEGEEATCSLGVGSRTICWVREEVFVELRNTTQKQLSRMLQDVDCLYVEGGNTFYLRFYMHASGFDDLVRPLIRYDGRYDWLQVNSATATNVCASDNHCLASTVCPVVQFPMSVPFGASRWMEVNKAWCTLVSVPAALPLEPPWPRRSGRAGTAQVLAQPGISQRSATTAWI